MFNWFRRKSNPQPPPSSTPARAVLLRITLPQDRTEYAQIVAIASDGNTLGSWIGIAKADQAAAAMARNPTCDWKLRFGETPTGEYELAEIRQPETSDEVKALGAGRYLVLHPLSGNAAAAEAHGRTTLLIHGGEAKPTDGSIRLPDQALAELVALLATSQVRVSIVEATTPINQAQATRAARNYDWQYQDADDSSSLFSYYCQYYAWSTLFNANQPSSLFNDQQPDPTPAFDPSLLADVNVIPLPDNQDPSNTNTLNQGIDSTNAPTNNLEGIIQQDPQTPIELEKPDPTPVPCEAPDPVGDTAYGR